MLGAEVRDSFLEFFHAKGHEIVPSAPIVPANDPTLMFTNAGMVQFKDIFLGNSSPAQPRVVNSQKCLRISGKHNDLEEVGRDSYHHTMFEMLGNWSFGDYYKAEAIEWAWELLTGVWGLPQDRLLATVYRSDAESEKLWKKISGMSADRVLRFDEKDNFWEMGATGPCGPCSEIHIDRGAAACDKQKVKGHQCEVNAGCARYIEIWNLVFIQHNRDASGQLHDLPSKHVDTGMGLERVAALLEQVDGNYDGSLLRGLIDEAEGLSGRTYGDGNDADVSFRVLADHGRAVSFMIADGLAPSNEGRGYVLRRLLRRAARHAKSIGLDDPAFHQVCERVVSDMGGAYPELVRDRELIVSTVKEEEERFAETLDRGLVHLDDAIASLGAKTKVLGGDMAFKLYDTYGFPLDMTADILRSHGMDVDRDGFEQALEEQRSRARGARDSGAVGDPAILVPQARERGGTAFADQFATESEAQVVALAVDGRLVETAATDQDVDIVVSSTPFYGESGGQVGDTGRMTTASGAIVDVGDTQRPAADVIVHRGRLSGGELSVGDTASLSIDGERRQAIRLNHSATHLLHAALRNHLGDGVAQAGSLVDAERLRFDFSHDGAVSDEKLADIEDEVNGIIRANLEVGCQEMPYKDALASGALAFFGEKYGDTVRVVRMGDYSVELCGGTHVARTGDIGLLTLAGQTAVAAGTRRVEAHSGRGALASRRERDSLLAEVAGLLGSAEGETPERVAKLVERIGKLEREADKASQVRSGDLVGGLLAAARELGDAKVVVGRADGVEGKAMRALSDSVRDRLGSSVVVLAGENKGSVAVVVAVTKDQTERFNAGHILGELVPLVGGRGGGKPDFAQGGGKDPSGIAALMEKANAIIV
ncbi:MAG: alanine--tRNA ligase [Deltaproteobacteria bacterium]